MDNLKNDIQIHIDYLSFTFPLNDEVPGSTILAKFDFIKEDIANLFYMTSENYGEINPWGQDNYNYQLTLGQNIVVRFGGTSTAMKKVIDYENGIKSLEKYESVNVELKGQACREIEFLSGGNVDYIMIFDYFQKLGGKATRIDIAIDDMKGDIITLNKIVNLVSKGLYTSSFRKSPELITSAVKDDDSKGTSLYFGKSTSKKRNALELCIYDKAAERRFNNDSYVSEYWTRYEMRFRYERAEHLSWFIVQNKLEDIGQFAQMQLFNILCLKQRTFNGKKTDITNISMLDNNTSWERFLGVVSKTKFSMRPVMENTIEKKVSWRHYSLTRQNILLEIADAYDSADYLDPALARLYAELKAQYIYLIDNKDKITKQDLEMINNYRREKFINNKTYRFVEITKKDIEEYISDLKERIDNFEKNFTLPF